MHTVSPKIEERISQFMRTGEFESVDDLLSRALDSLLKLEQEEALRQYLILAKTEGEDIEMTADFLEKAMEEALRELDAEKALRRAS